MDVIPVRTSAEWNRLLASIPNAHVLQTWEWGEVKSKVGWTPTRLVFADNGIPLAAAQVLRRPLPHTPFGIQYVPKGPALDYHESPLFATVLGHLEQHARNSRAIFVKVDPDVLRNAPEAECLAARGWQVSAEQIQYKNTVTLDLARSEPELLAAMKPKWRYNIRLAEKKNVRVERGNETELPLFYRLYAETGSRDGFLIRQFPYYEDVWGTMLRGGMAHVLFARVGPETIAGLILFLFADRAWYFYGASAGRERDLMPNHLLQWEAIRLAKALGCRIYDFWGAPDNLSQGEPMYGVYKFKMGFGGQFVEHIPAYDFVALPSLFRLYSLVRPKYLARLRGKHNLSNPTVHIEA